MSVSKQPFEKIVLNEDLRIKMKKRAGDVILYAGTYKERFTSKKGGYYFHSSNTFAIDPLLGSPEKFEGGLYIPNNKTEECLIFWAKPSATRLGLFGALPAFLASQDRNGVFDASKFEFYTWTGLKSGEIKP